MPAKKKKQLGSSEFRTVAGEAFRGVVNSSDTGENTRFCEGLAGICLPDSKALLAMRERYLATGNDEAGVRPVVLESWQRCRAHGLNPRVLCRQSPDRELLAVARRESHALLSAAEPLLALAHQTLADQPHLLALSDANARILRLWTDPLTQGAGNEACNLFEGASWSERDVGCNGIGTCLHVAEPVILIGPEHFQEEYVGWTCIGVPLKTSDGSVIGALDLSVPNPHVRPHTWGWILSVAATIEVAVAAQDGGDAPALLPPDLANPLNTVRGVLDLLVRQLRLSPPHSHFVEEARRDLDTADQGLRLAMSALARTQQELVQQREALAMDVTERKLAEESLRESERRFREVLENSLDAAYRRDLRTDTYDYVSPVIKKVFDIEPDVLQSMSVAQLIARIHPDDRDDVTSAIEKGIAAGAGRVEYRFQGDDGQYRWLADHFTVQKDPDGKPISRGGIVREITELRKAQDALKEDDRRKDEFLAMLGHELRNPLAAITTGLRLLRSPNAQQHEWVKDSIERQTKQLVSLVDDLLDISRITRGKIQLRSQIIDLRTIADSAAESTADLMAEKKHAFTVSRPERPLWTLGDPTRLQQIIANLLNNAAKYTPDGGRIELTLARVHDEAVITVKDNGIGIPADMQESIFELFGQVDSEAHRPQQGLGIGLSLVKRLVGLHGGRVSLASEGPGKGTEFTVRLAIAQGAENLAHDARSHEPPDEEPLDILVVEDTRETAQFLSAILQDKGHTVRVAETGTRATELAAERQPDLVLLDIGLPDISGYQVAEKLRKELGYHRTLILAATGYGQEKDRQRSRRAGIDHHLVKPIEYEAVAVLVREWRRTPRGGPLPDGPRPSAEASSPGPVRSARILIIDDTRAIARMMQQMLQADGYQAEVAFDGPSGVEVAGRFRPDLVLCDLNLPGASGFDVLKALKSDAALNGTLVAAMTGYDGDEYRERTSAAGFDAHLVKPIEMEQIQDLIRRLESSTVVSSGYGPGRKGRAPGRSYPAGTRKRRPTA